MKIRQALATFLSFVLIANTAAPAFAYVPHPQEDPNLRAYETPGTPGPLAPFSHEPGQGPQVRTPSGSRKSRNGHFTDSQADAIDEAMRLKRLRYDPEDGQYLLAVIGEIHGVEPVLPPSGSGNGGSAFPGEVETGGWNSQTGNKQTELHITDWKSRGDTGIDMTLYHNSLAVDIGSFGYNWTSTYETVILNSGTSRIIKWADGTSVLYTVGSTSGTVTSYNTPAGFFDALKYDSSSTKYTITTHDFETYEFNSSGYLTAIKDRSGNAVTVSYVGGTGPTLYRATDANGRYLEFTYTGGFVSRVEDSTGRKWDFDTDKDGIHEIIFPVVQGSAPTYQIAYNADNRITKLTDLRGKEWFYTYVTSGTDIGKLLKETDPTGIELDYLYGVTRTIGGSSYTCSAIADDNSKEQRFAYGVISGLTAIALVVDEAGHFDTYTSYNSNYLPLLMNDKRSKTWTYTYDSSGNKLTVKNPLSKTWTMTYTAYNDINTVTTPLGYVTDYDYNGSNLLSEIKDPLTPTARSTKFFYDGYGQVNKVTDNNNKDVLLTRTGDDDVTTVRDQLVHDTTIVYDGLGRPTTFNKPEGTGDSLEYDAWGRVKKVTHRDSTTILIEYDGNDNVTKVTNELGKATNYAYDDAGRLYTVTNANTEVQTYYYDTVGDLDHITNAKSETRYYYHNERHELTSIKMPDYASGKREWWSYDGNGNVTERKNPIDQMTYYTYDDANRQTDINYTTGTDPTFTYDNDNRMTVMTDSTGTTTYTYNSASEVTSLATPQGTMTYTYDSLGRRATMVEGALTTTYTYDDASRLITIQNGNSETTTLTYDDADRIEKKDLHNGMWEDYAYDTRDRLTSVTVKKPGPVTEYSETYSYGYSGNLDSATRGTATTAYTYDDVEQLLSENISGSWKQEYTYDANGNRTSFKRYLGGSGTPSINETYTYNAGDLLATAGSKSFTYDGCGRTKTVSVSGTLQRTYHWDYQDRLITTQYPDGGGTYDTNTYNGFNARMVKTTNSGSNTTTYKRDGTSVLSSVLTEGGRQHTPGISYRESGATKYYTGDRLGTNGKEYDSSKANTSSMTTDAFGNDISTSGSTNSPFKFAGKWGYQSDGGNSGLQLLGNRFYDPTLGRFLTRDPIHHGKNWFTYCSNNPLKSIDPSGYDDVQAVGKLIDKTARGAAKAGIAAAVVAIIEGIFKNPGRLLPPKKKPKDPGFVVYLPGQKEPVNGISKPGSHVYPPGTTVVPEEGSGITVVVDPTSGAVTVTVPPDKPKKPAKDGPTKPAGGDAAKSPKEKKGEV